MAPNGAAQSLQIHRLPQPKYIDAVRWVPPLSAFDRFIVLAVFDSDTDEPAVEIHALNHSDSPSLSLQSSFSPPSRISALRTSQFLHKPFIAASTLAGSLHILLADPINASFESEVSISGKSLHDGPISDIDVQENASDCVTVGEDGRVNLVTFSNSRLNHRRIFDSNGLVSYTAAKWASPFEFATGGLGHSVQWWDHRKPGAPATQFKGSWDRGTTSGIVHSIDIHPSRKYTCLVGGSSGSVFAWDIRWSQQPVMLSGYAAGGESSFSAASESEVWQVQYDNYSRSSSNISNVSSSSQILPAMICSEDGILAVVQQGEQPIELLAEPCAINSFDIDRQNPSVSLKQIIRLG
ncbi:nuclear pore complex protein NUP43 [Impatiens glandulifera]|uniref:nuclear pore complex protein NUP43 n=1 Tax=Impatiens glandulifera TaxID=253017 RepID=UPI001FB160A3|nr:nuclear pore complex protein NUP43 [Impatiens glandulifera]